MSIGPAPRTVTVATGPTGGEEVVLDLGAAHPTAHGVLRVRLVLDAEGTVLEAEPLAGFLHRGAEKLFEVRDYRAGLALANRHDWLNAFGDELVLAIALEGMLGMDVPERAVWLRTLLAELGRVLSSLAFLGAAPRAIGSAPDGARATADAAFAARERFTGLLADATGGRLHPMAVAVGGLLVDVPGTWLDDLAEATATARSTWLPALPAGLHDDAVFLARCTGAGVVAEDVVMSYGASGPVARGSGVALDLRVGAAAGLAYPSLQDLLEPVVASGGDAAARFDVVLREAARSLDLLDACAQRLRELGPGPVAVPLPKVLRVPEGEGRAWLEGPSGITGVHVESRGDRTPSRVALRTPSYAHASMLADVLPGTSFDALVPTLASLLLVVGDVDK